MYHFAIAWFFAPLSHVLSHGLAVAVFERVFYSAWMTTGHSTPPRLPDDVSWRTCVRHVWVVRQSISHEREVGILLAWRRTRRGEWEGWVVYADPGIPAHGGGPRVQQEWVEAGRIVPVE